MQMTVKGTWSKEQCRWHINMKELMAAWLVLKHFVEVVKGLSVLLATDNSTVVAYVNRQGGTRSSNLFRITQQLYTWLGEHRIALRARHIPGRLNVLADELSREKQVLPTEWSLLPQVLEMVWRQWEKPHIDLFATRFNNKLPVFVSPLPDPRAYAVDALSMKWDHLLAYAFPPTAVLGAVLSKLAETKDMSLVLVAPAWQKQSWFVQILDHLVDLPLELPVWDKLLRQPRSGIFHDNPGVYQLHAWKLSSSRIKVAAFRRTLHEEWQELKSPQPLEFMRESGRGSRIGVVAGKWIRSVPLDP